MRSKQFEPKRIRLVSPRIATAASVMLMRGPRGRRNRGNYRAAVDPLRTSGDIHQRSARNTQFGRLSNSIFEIVLLPGRQEFGGSIRDVAGHFHRHKMARIGHINHASVLELLRDFSADAPAPG